jgi:hypothetical protein
MHFPVDKLGRKSGFFKDSKKKKPEQLPATYTIFSKIKILAKTLHPLLSPSFRHRPESMATARTLFLNHQGAKAQSLTEFLFVNTAPYLKHKKSVIARSRRRRGNPAGLRGCGLPPQLKTRVRNDVWMSCELAFFLCETLRLRALVPWW